MEMTTKHLVIFAGGVLAGYLLMDYLRKQKQQVTPVTEPPVAVVDPKVANCEASLLEALKTVRIGADQLEAYKAQFMADCLANTNEASKVVEEYGMSNLGQVGQFCVAAYEPAYIEGTVVMQNGMKECVPIQRYADPLPPNSNAEKLQKYKQ